jgi:hypothetical protein
MNTEQKKVKVAYCWCEKGIFLAATLPEAEADKRIVKDFVKYAKQGYRIDYMPVGEMKDKFYKCDCFRKQKPDNNPKLF